MAKANDAAISVTSHDIARVCVVVVGLFANIVMRLDASKELQDLKERTTPNILESY